MSLKRYFFLSRLMRSCTVYLCKAERQPEIVTNPYGVERVQPLEDDAAELSLVDVYDEFDIGFFYRIAEGEDVTLPVIERVDFPRDLVEVRAPRRQRRKVELFEQEELGIELRPLYPHLLVQGLRGRTAGHERGRKESGQANTRAAHQRPVSAGSRRSTTSQ